MYYWVGIEVEEQLDKLKEKVLSISKELKLDYSCYKLPFHISLKMPFKVSKEKQKKIYSTLCGVISSLDPFTLKTDKIEIHDNICWLTYKHNDDLDDLHDQLVYILEDVYKIKPHEYDLDYLFHTTLFMDEDSKKIAKAYSKIKDFNIKKEVRVNRMIIGQSSDNSNGSYEVICSSTIDETKRNFIWDLDGTLLDSYKVIIDSLYQTCKEYGYSYSKDEIHKYIIKYSVNAFIKEKIDAPFDEVKTKYRALSETKVNDIKAIKNAKEALETLSLLGYSNFVFTHRGPSTDGILENLGLKQYFKEIITTCSNFKRKPDPEAINYLIKKYHLVKKNTYYVGDRRLDMECALNAKIKGILYLEKDAPIKASGIETYIVSDLLDITKIDYEK